MGEETKAKIIVALITGVLGIVGGAIGGSAVTNNMVTSEVQNITNVDTGDAVDIVSEQTERAVSAEAKVEELNQNISELEKKIEELQKNNSVDKSSNEGVVQESDSQGTGDAISFSKVPDILYDGSLLQKYSGDGSFKVGGVVYKYGFTLSSFSSGNAFFNLNQEYKTVKFNTGRLDNSSQSNAVLYVYSGDDPIGEYQLSGNKTFQTVELEVSGIDTLILELKTDEYGGQYGFFDVEFYK